MHRFLSLFILLASCLPVLGQTVKQSGNVTPGHAASWTTNGIIQDAGTAANGFLTSLGVVGQGETICQRTAPPTAPGYQQLCWNLSDTNGVSLIVQNYGTDTPQPFSIVLNGVTYPFPFGQANLVGTAPIVVTPSAGLFTIGLTNPLAIAYGGTGQATASAAIAALMPTPTRAGDVAYWNGLIWTNFAGNNSGTNCLGENAVGAPQWTTCSGGSGANPGGSNTQIQYNASSTFGGMSTFTTDGTNLALTAGTLTIKDSGNAVILNTPSTAQSSCVPFQSNGTTKWTICKNTDDSLSIVDSASTNTVFQIASNGGMQVMGAGGYFIAGTSFYADTAGHPYCDVRTFGAGGGVPSTDQTSIASALSACSGGVVFFPCGAYHNTATWSVVAPTSIRVAARGCVSITTTLTNADVFNCTGGGNGMAPIVIDGLQIYGVGSTTGGSVPTAGYAINCANGGNQQTINNNEINGTFGGIYIGGTNGRATDNRIESIYGTTSIYEPLGGNRIEGNQLDNNSEFNATGGGGFGTAITYNTSSPASVTAGTIASSNGFFFIATVGGTTAPIGAGITVSPMYKNITDGTVTWQLIGNTGLILIEPGTETWIIDNDMTSPANFAIDLDGNLGANRNWVRGNDIAGEYSGGIVLINTAQFTTIQQNQMFQIGYNLGGVITGFPIWDQGTNGIEAFTNISGNVIEANDAAIIWQGDYSNINNNNINNGAVTHQFCGITTSGSGGHPVGVGIVGNFVSGNSPGAICMDGSSGTRTTVVGNSVLGGTISLVGTSIVNTGNN